MHLIRKAEASLRERMCRSPDEKAVPKFTIGIDEIAEYPVRVLSDIHPSRHLRERLSLLRFPSGVAPIPTPIPGKAFFPGGHGLWREQPTDELPPWPINGVMLVGHDFDCQTSYEASLLRGEEAPAGTWDGTTDLLASAGIIKSECFFTNFFMGVRLSKQNTGRHPGTGDPRFVSDCVTFFLEQVCAQRPKLILVLGREVPRHLAKASPDLAHWAKCRTFPQLDASPFGGPLRRGATFTIPGGEHTAVVAIVVHPCMRRANLWRRHYAGLQGPAAEQRLVDDAKAAVGFRRSSGNQPPFVISANSNL